MSSRNLTTGMTTEIAKPEVAPIVFVELAFDSDTLRVWSGYGSLSWSGNTWLGSGDMGSLSAVTETEELTANGVTLSLSGIPSENIALALTEKYRGRPGKIWLGFLNAAMAVIANPKQVFSGRMDVMVIDEGAETSTISISLESRAIDLLRTRERRYTHEDQQIDFPGDMGLEFVSDLQNKDVRWVPS